MDQEDIQVAFKGKEDVMAGLFLSSLLLSTPLKFAALKLETRPDLSGVKRDQASLAMQSSKSGGVSFEWCNLVSKWHFSRHQKADKSGGKSAKCINQPN